ncbi:MAG: hypothetical protein HYV13_00465 [Candidatus Doudnabacteria bacterium]|nr:hypothetical protein [Candidatus Doudnabacteria bacterium]
MNEGDLERIRALAAAKFAQRQAREGTVADAQTVAPPPVEPTSTADQIGAGFGDETQFSPPVAVESSKSETDSSREPVAPREAEPIRPETGVFGDVETVEAIAANNLTVFKKWLAEGYGMDEQTLKRALGTALYALLSGDTRGYLENRDKPFDGDPEFVEAIRANNAPILKKWLTDNYGMTDEQLETAFGTQTYRALGFDRPMPQEDVAEAGETKAAAGAQVETKTVAEKREEKPEEVEVNAEELKNVLALLINDKLENIKVSGSGNAITIDAELVRGRIIKSKSPMRLELSAGQNGISLAKSSPEITGMSDMIYSYFSAKFGRVVSFVDISNGKLVVETIPAGQPIDNRPLTPKEIKERMAQLANQEQQKKAVDPLVEIGNKFGVELDPNEVHYQAVKHGTLHEPRAVRFGNYSDYRAYLETYSPFERGVVTHYSNVGVFAPNDFWPRLAQKDYREQTRMINSGRAEDKFLNKPAVTAMSREQEAQEHRNTGVDINREFGAYASPGFDSDADGRIYAIKQLRRLLSGSNPNEAAGLSFEPGRENTVEANSVIKFNPDQSREDFLAFLRGGGMAESRRLVEVNEQSFELESRLYESGFDVALFGLRGDVRLATLQRLNEALSGMPARASNEPLKISLVESGTSFLPQGRIRISPDMSAEQMREAIIKATSK